MALLSGFRVLDFGRFIAGPCCAALLGDLGADVIRVERIGGGEDRRVPQVADTGDGGLYLQVNRNKRCLTLDLAHDDGRRIVRQQVEGSLLRSARVVANPLLIEQALRAPDRVPQGNRGCTSAPSDVFRARDGWLLVQTIGQPMFERWCAMVGRSELIADPRFADDESRGAGSRLISEVMAGWCADKPRAEVLAALAAAKIPAAPVLSPQQALDDPHIRAAGLLPQRPVSGSAQHAPIAPHPLDLSLDPPVFARSAPALGEHTEQILAELGCGAAAVAGLRARRVV